MNSFRRYALTSSVRYSDKYLEKKPGFFSWNKFLLPAVKTRVSSPPAGGKNMPGERNPAFSHGISSFSRR
ncbi:Uncharacterized protein dnm_041000 [Desulfonema magnum]|uniref:Uncharacterized protein n=1 Tax=Desulfonema magnum TaxID=45655 RepID=A0A975BNB0_9BACT|nr:Uncharacterized protein dnm_041000 [Desulfonema magnum]